MSQLKKNIIANFAGKGWAALMSLAFIPLYIRFIGIEAYGLIGFFSLLLALFSLLDLGLSTTLNRELARMSVQAGKEQEMRNLVRSLELVYWAVALSIGIAVILLSPLIAQYWVKADKLSTDTIYQAVMIMGLAITFQWPFSLYSGGLMGLQQQVLLNGITSAIATLRWVGAAIILWKISPTIQAFFIWQITISVVQTFITGAFLWIRLPASHQAARFKKDIFFGIWRFAAGMTGISVMAVILTQLDKVILSRVLTLEMFGYYSLAGMVAGSLYYFIGPVFSALFPRFSQLATLNDNEALRLLYHRSCQLVSVVILPVMVVVAFFSKEFLILWTGNVAIADNTHLILSLLIVGTAINGLMNLPYALQLAYGWTKLAFYTNVVAVILLGPLIYVMTLEYGAVGAAIVWVILNSGYVLISLQIMHLRLFPDEKWRWYIEDVGKPLMAALLTAGLGRLLISGSKSPNVMLAYLFGIFIATLFMSTLAASHIRRSIIYKLQMAKL